MELSKTAVVILGMLGRQPRSGYDIKQAVDRSTRFFWAASYGQLYPELKRLETAGLVASHAEPTGGRRRQVHRLTAAGRRALLGWLASPGGSVEVRDELLLKLFFADLSPGTAPDALDALRRHHEAALHRLEAIRSDPAMPSDTFPVRVLELGIGHHRAWVRQVEALAEQLRAQAADDDEES